MKRFGGVLAIVMMTLLTVAFAVLCQWIIGADASPEWLFHKRSDGVKMIGIPIFGVMLGVGALLVSFVIGVTMYVCDHWSD